MFIFFLFYNKHMPARKSAESVRAYINKYGFDFSQGHTYHNNYTDGTTTAPALN